MPDWTEQSAEIQASHDREREAIQRYEDLFRYLQSHVQDSQVRIYWLKAHTHVHV